MDPFSGKRRAPHVTIEELAHRADVSVGYLNRLELGNQCNPSCRVILAIANALRIRAADLLTFRILVAEDDEHVLKAYRRMFDGISDNHDIDVELTYALNGAKALESIKLQTPDMVFSDVLMPEMGGVELTRRIKTDPATAAIPVIGVSGFCEPDEITNAGADLFFSKPLTAEHVVEVMQAFTWPVLLSSPDTDDTTP